MVAPEVAAEVFANPEALRALPHPALVDLRRRLAHLVADADALLSKPTATAEPAKVLTMSEAALMLRCSRDALYRKHSRLKLGYVDPLDGRLKFRSDELARYVGQRR